MAVAVAVAVRVRCGRQNALAVQREGLVAELKGLDRDISFSSVLAAGTILIK